MKKQCSKCHEMKSSELFYTGRNACKACCDAKNKLWVESNRERQRKTVNKCDAKHSEKRREQWRAYYYSNVEKSREYSRTRKLKNYESMMLQRAKDRAKKLNLDFNLDLSDIVIPSHCPVLGVALIPGAPRGSPQAQQAPSLDRLDNALGYVKGNILVISLRANWLKGAASLEEMEALAQFYRTIVNKKAA